MPIVLRNATTIRKNNALPSGAVCVAGMSDIVIKIILQSYQPNRGAGQGQAAVPTSAGWYQIVVYYSSYCTCHVDEPASSIEMIDWMKFYENREIMPILISAQPRSPRPDY